MKGRMGFLSILIVMFAGLIFAGCDSGTPATPTVTSEVPGINVTQGDYDAALAKWKALNVQEYKETVNYSAFAITAGEWELDVTPSTTTPISFQRNGTPEPTPAVDSQALFLLTVEGAFNAVERALQPQDGQSYVFKYEVTFDPDKGYPTHFAARNVPDPVTGSQVADADYSIDITSLTVVK